MKKECESCFECAGCGETFVRSPKDIEMTESLKLFGYVREDQKVTVCTTCFKFVLESEEYKKWKELEKNSLMN